MKGWFAVNGVQEGDRTVAEQLTGMDTVLANARDKTVLDFGCAEGLISLALVKDHGARSAFGVSVVKTEILAGRKLCEGYPVTLRRINLDNFAKWEFAKPPELAHQYDIVLMLSILHKLRYPGVFLERVLAYAGDLVVVRLPFPVINDYRSRHVPCDVRPILEKSFVLVEEPVGPRGEWLSLWARRKG